MKGTLAAIALLSIAVILLCGFQQNEVIVARRRSAGAPATVTNVVGASFESVALAASTSRWKPVLWGGQSTPCSTEPPCEAQVPENGTIANLYFTMPTAPASGTNITATLEYGTFGSASDSALTCTITGNGSTHVCSDTSHSVSVTAGGAWSMKITKSNTGTLTTNLGWTMTYNATDNVVGGLTNQSVGSGNTWGGPFGLFGSNPPGSELLAEGPVVVTGTLKNLYFSMPTAPGAGITTTATLEHCTTAGCGAPDTTVTCGITGASAHTCNDTTHTVSVTAGDFWSVKVNNSGSIAATIPYEWTLAEASSSGLLGGGFEINVGSGDAYIGMPGGGGAYGANAAADATAISKAGTLSNFTLVLPGAAPGVGNTVTATIDKCAAASWGCTPSETGVPSCSITGSATSCTDNTHTLSVAAGDYLTLHINVSGSYGDNVYNWSVVGP